ncbi:Putative ABC transporter, ATP-binding protein [Rhodococcus aetherivorans]|nr:Putative ABC transporter, ATP-binding protein [Rhodococcus aetherivorans]
MLVTHDLDAVRAVAQRVIVMGGGRVLETGDAAILPVAAPRIPQTRADSADCRPTRADARLILDAVSAGYRNTEVLQRYSLSLQPGECLALHGPSGCGKTTAARVVAGLHPPTAGRVLLDGHPLAASVRRRTRHQAAAIGYVFQDAKAAFDPYRSVWDQILRGPTRLRGATGPEAAAAARRALDQVGLAERITRQHPSALSGGEAQRAALARVLAVEPSLLICDEVTTGLDPASRQRVLDILSDLVRTQRISLLMISHDGAVVDAVADRIVDMTLPATNGEPP